MADDVVKLRMAFNADYTPFRSKCPLTRWRVDHKVTISETARMLGTNRQAVNAWETGLYCPSVKYIRGIAKLLGFRSDEDAERAWERWYATKPRVQ